MEGEGRKAGVWFACFVVVVLRCCVVLLAPYIDICVICDIGRSELAERNGICSVEALVSKGERTSGFLRF